MCETLDKSPGPQKVQLNVMCQVRIVCVCFMCVHAHAHVPAQAHACVLEHRVQKLGNEYIQLMVISPTQIEEYKTSTMALLYYFTLLREPMELHHRERFS